MTQQIRLGGAYLYDGKPYRVAILNECRARLDPAFTVPRTITNRFTGRSVTIQTRPEPVSISNRAQLTPATI